MGLVDIVKNCTAEGRVADAERNAQAAGDKVAVAANALRKPDDFTNKLFPISSESLHGKFMEAAGLAKETQSCSLATALYNVAQDSAVTKSSNPAGYFSPSTRITTPDGEKQIYTDGNTDQTTTAIDGHRKRIAAETAEVVAFINQDGRSSEQIAEASVKFLQFIESEYVYGTDRMTKALANWGRPSSTSFPEYENYRRPIAEALEAPVTHLKNLSSLQERLRKEDFDTPESRKALSSDLQKLADKAGFFRDHAAHIANIP